MAVSFSSSRFKLRIGETDIICSSIKNLVFTKTFTTSRTGEEPSQTVENTLGNKLFEPLILEKPLSKGDNTFFRLWRDGNNEKEVNGQLTYDPITIQILDNESKSVATWILVNPQMTKLSYSDFDAQGNSVLVERLEVIYEDIDFRM